MSAAPTQQVQAPQEEERRAATEAAPHADAPPAEGEAGTTPPPPAPTPETADASCAAMPPGSASRPPVAASAAAAPSPRRSRDFGSPGHARQIRLAAILRGCSEQPDTLFSLLGTDRIADAFPLPPAAVERIIGARASVRRRFARRIRERVGLSLEHLQAASMLPDDPQELLRAARLFAVAIRLAGTKRVMSRIDFQTLNDRWGAEAVAFGSAQKSILDRHAEALAEYRHDEAPNLTDLRLFVRSLAAHGHAGAAIVALQLGLPVTLATAPVANLDLALETGLPSIAAAALDAVGKGPAPESVADRSIDDEAAWQADASADEDPSSNPDSTEAA